MKRFWIAMVAASLLAIAAFAPAAAQDTVTIDLDEVDGSGHSGTATLTASDGEIMVSLELSGGDEDGVHPVHIHDGTCDDLGGVAYPLEDVEGGMSESTVEVSLDDLMTGAYAINAHLSADEMGTNIVCGDIPMAEGEDENGAEDDEDEMDDEEDEEDDAEDVPPAAGSTGGVGTGTAVLSITLLAGAMMGAGLLVRRRAYKA